MVPGRDHEDEAATPGAVSRQTIVIFRELHGMTGRGEYVFLAVNSLRRLMSNKTLNTAPMRATASTLLDEMGRWNPGEALVDRAKDLCSAP
jgi:hypothetical protein